MQSGNETAQLKMLELRLAKDEAIAALIDQSRKTADVSEQKALNNLLTTFYIKPAAADQEGSIEFAHKSFGEFLFAERLKEAIEDWSKLGERRRGQYLVPEEELHWEIYDLLGYGGLSPEITGCLMVMLEDSAKWNPIVLFERLNDFWERWCEGEFIDSAPENLPQRKMRLLREQISDRVLGLGVRQVDIFAGLNCLILLLCLHRYSQERIELKDENRVYLGIGARTDGFKDRLGKVIRYSDCLELGSFEAIVGYYLSVSNLSRPNLNRAYPSYPDLSGVNLSGTDLSGVDLRGANLSGANLRDADLSSADLRGADRRGADPIIAYLGNTDPKGTDLRDANLSGVDLEGIQWDEFTNWSQVQGLGTAINIPEALKQQLGLP
jgi:Pentapeptide repeats (8 copies)